MLGCVLGKEPLQNVAHTTLQTFAPASPTPPPPSQTPAVPSSTALPGSRGSESCVLAVGQISAAAAPACVFLFPSDSEQHRLCDLIRIMFSMHEMEMYQWGNFVFFAMQ